MYSVTSDKITKDITKFIDFCESEHTKSANSKSEVPTYVKYPSLEANENILFPAPFWLRYAHLQLINKHQLLVQTTCCSLETCAFTCSHSILGPKVSSLLFGPPICKKYLVVKSPPKVK